MIFTEKLACPVCAKKLSLSDKSLKCENGHCFDIAKEGYVNLLSGSHKSAELIGDNKSMAKSRQDFLSKGYFDLLANYIAKQVKHLSRECPAVLDICCGEGYYSKKVLEEKRCALYGFDISRSMIRLAAKRKLDASFFVANLSHIPLKSESIDFAFHLFAPFHESEFSRILKKDGVLLTAVPGENHLFELKESVYAKPYKNDEKLPETESLKLMSTQKLSGKIQLNNNGDIMSLFKMTPYYYRTSQKDKSKLDTLNELETTVEFVVGAYKRHNNNF